MCDTNKDFVQLHNHSDISVQDALAKPKALAMKMREMGFPAGALTDHGRMGGIVDFVEGCRAPHDEWDTIKPIVGCEVYTCPDMLDKQSVERADGTKGRPKHNHLTLLAKNATGYKNLLQIASIGAEKGYYYDPRVDWSVIEAHHEGVIAMSGCLGSETSQAIMRGEDDKAEAIMRRFKDTFGSDYYAELQYHGIPEQKVVLDKLVPLAYKLGVPTVASNDVHYLEHKDWEVHDILIQMRDLAADKKSGKGGKKEAYGTHQFWLKSAAEMNKIFHNYDPKAMHNSVMLAETVEDYFKLDVPHLLPHVAIPTEDARFRTFRIAMNMVHHKDNDAYLAYLAYSGLRALGMDRNKDYIKRLRYELSIVSYMGCTDYFLIQHEMVQFMREKEIMYGIRGSGVGSLINYCLKVSLVDPLRWHLLFERFLNPGRGTQFKVDLSCYPVKQWLADNGKIHDQSTPLLRLQRLFKDAEDHEWSAPFRPQMAKELWVLENQELAAYICDVADRGLTTSGNDSQLWSAYLLGITNKMPEGDMPVSKVASLPDVDTDIDDRRRQEVIEWTRGRFGADHVAMIGTRGTYQAKAAVLNSLKVSDKFNQRYGVDVSKMALSITKTIPNRQQPPMTIEDALKESPEFASWARRYPEEVEIAKRLVGVVSHLGIHAGGVLVSSEPICHHAPLENNKGTLASAYDMSCVERVGLVKYDYLGLATYQMLSRALALIAERHGPEAVPDMENLDLDDRRVFRMYADGKTSSVFQFASKGMQSACREVKVDNLHDVIAIAALYRPGPMEFIPDYAAGKRDPSTVKYAHPLIEKHLKETFAIGVYQEQIMMLCREMAGLTWLELDKLRKAISKKNGVEFDAACNLFKQKALASQVPAHAVDEVLRLMAKFGGYAFNRSHASAYGILSYWTAYLRTYFPAEWMAACMHVDRDDEDKMAVYRKECQGERIAIMLPNINTSGLETGVTKSGAITLPLTSIKGVGAQAQDIVDNQPYCDLLDFATRARPNRGMVAALAEYGALECLPDVKECGADTEAIMVCYDDAVERRTQAEKSAAREAKRKYIAPNPFGDQEEGGEEEGGAALRKPDPKGPRPPRPANRVVRIQKFDMDMFSKDIL